LARWRRMVAFDSTGVGRPAVMNPSRHLSSPPSRPPLANVPVLIAAAGDQAAKRFLEFFAANIRNPQTRRAYARSAGEFLAWCERVRIPSIMAVEPVHVATYIEKLLKEDLAAPTIKQNRAAIRHLFDWLVVGQIVPVNPAASVRGPTHIVKKGKTPVLSPEEARRLLDSIDITTHAGLRDRALIALMVYSFARPSQRCIPT
jgi:integrase/recombinase XerC